MALKASVAAMAAWLIALRLPTATDQYAFYAPFGAIATMYPAVARSASQSVRAVVAISLGAATGLGVELLLGNGVLALGLVVGVGMLLAGLPWLGENRSYVPIVALFVVLLGQGDEVGYAGAYAGLFLLGAVVGVLVNAAVPAFPVQRADHALDRLREVVADHLADAAEQIRDGRDLDTADAHAPGGETLARATDRARRAIDDLTEAAQANPRARLRPDAAPTRRATFRALERTVLLVDDLYALADDQPWGARAGAVAPQMRGPLADALAQLGQAVLVVGPLDDKPGPRADVEAAMHALAAALEEHEQAAGPDPEGLVVATVLTTLRRTLAALTPTDRIALARDVAPGPARTEEP
ncbi:hypothetical protein GCM10011331_18310 [Flavimobilis marinus]|uniref:Aromatic acid exporter family member 1 n=2 Tax=Flavimobilis marinus TaxID=285351 RepID=A0A1I2F6E0_9MICO|nr:hypothetical protein GCM10011331_18310 [Flavimobilis marinus]SFF00278.1 hypothetical protein SAMN04488035_1124 [Flavimobilis marinus]